MQQCPYKTPCALRSAPSELETEEKHVWPICVVMSQREVKKLNSNLIASSHSLQFNSATVVQKDKGRLCFSAFKKKKKKTGVVEVRFTSSINMFHFENLTEKYYFRIFYSQYCPPVTGEGFLYKKNPKIFTIY